MLMTEEELIARGKARHRLRSAPEFARLIRARAGVTQDELAQILGVDRSAVSRWESGSRMPRPNTLARYSQLLDRLERAS